MLLFYQIWSKCCISKLTNAIPTQQQAPINIGFAPDLISLTICVLSPIADIAITIKNLLNSFIGSVIAGDRLNTVVITAASTK